MKGAVLILGATSAMARGVADALAVKGHPLHLAARDAEELQRLTSDLQIRHDVAVSWSCFDALNTDEHPTFIDQVLRTEPELEGVVLAFGDLGDQQACNDSDTMALQSLQSNLVGAVSLLNPCARYLEQRGRGFIIGITSVAGDRGRQSNYLYGAAKGGLALYLQGLRNRLYPAGVRVITIKPGFVDTAMTFGLPGLFLVADPKRIGRLIAASVDQRADIRYLPGFWRLIMWIIRTIPEPLFKRLKL